MNKEIALRYFLSAPHACSYLPQQQASTVFTDPKQDINEQLYSNLAEHGFRRSGSDFYRPRCQHCQACIPLRIAVQKFQPNRTQRRTWRHMTKISTHIRTAEFDEEHFNLYCRYLKSRHKDGGMDNPTEESYLSFLSCKDITTHFIEFRISGKLLSVAVVDQLKNSWSAVYTFFDPEMDGLSPGVLAILWEINHCKNKGMDWLYMGYWIKSCQKMSYKQNYRPCQIYSNKEWQYLTIP